MIEETDPVPPEQSETQPDAEVSPPVHDGETVHWEKMEMMTGLCHRQLQNIAKKGWFPMPVRGMYQLIPSVRGVFKYYQQRDPSEKISHVKLEREKAKLRAEMVNADEAEKSVVKKSVAKQSLLRFVLALKAKQQVLPRRFGAEFAMISDGQKIEETLKAALRDTWETVQFEDHKLECPHCGKGVVED